MELDSPVELLDSLCFILSRLLDEVLAKLAPLATNELRVILTLEQAPAHITTLRLPVPMSDSKALLKILHLELSGNPPRAHRQGAAACGTRGTAADPARLVCRLFARCGAAGDHARARAPYRG